MARDPKEASQSSGGPGAKFYVALGALAVVGVAALVFARDGGSPEPVGPLSQATVEVEPDSGAYAAAKGPEDAPVTLVEFADYQCSHCASFASLPGPAIRRDYVQSGQVRMILYDFPLSRRTNAIPAALAARCAGDQGKYWEMHDLLFSRQRAWAPDQSPEDKFADYARQVGLDMGAFNECYSGKEHIRAIMQSRRYGEQMQVSGTPAIFVNGTQATDYSYEQVSGLIEAKLDSASASSGTAASTGGEGDAGG